MESTIYGVPLSAAQMGPSNNNISGITIRAPLTMDDSDSIVSSDYGGVESEGFESGEDMLETSPFDKEDEDNIEEAGLVKRFSVSEGAVIGLNGETIEVSSSNERGFVQQRGDVSENSVSRPFARIPKGRIYERGGDFVDSDDSESILRDSSDDELAENEDYVAIYSNSRPVVAVVNDEVSEEELTPVVRVPSARKLSIPIAKISGDSDDDSGGSEVLDDEGLSGVVRGLSIEVLSRTNSATKVRMLEADEGDENKSQAEDVGEMELDGNLLASGLVFSPLDEKEPIVVEKSPVQDNVSDFDKENMASLSAMNDVLNPKSELGHPMHLDEEIKEVDIVDDCKEYSELVDQREPPDSVEGIVMSDISDIASGAEFEFFDKLTVPEVGELGSNNYFGAASLSNVDSMSSNINQNNESEIVESIKQEVDHTLESFNSKDTDKIIFGCQCVDVKEVPAEGYFEFPELPEAVTESMSVCRPDSLFEDVIQSVFEGSKLEQETGKGPESSDLLPGEVEHFRFHSDNKPEIVEWDMEQDSSITESGGILLAESQHIDGQVVEDFDDEVDIDGGMSDHRHMLDPAALSMGVRSGVSDDDVEFLSVDPSSINGEQKEASSEREMEKIREIQRIRVKYLCLLERLGCSPEYYVASKVLYQLTLVAGSSYPQSLHLDSITAAMELESHKTEDLDLPLSILIIGKTGVGKSATINSIFGERAAVIDAFEPATMCVKEFVGLINGVKLKVFDTPGLRTSLMDQSENRKILTSIKKLMKKSPPDVILYVDRVDTQRGDLNDLPLMRLVTSCLGSSIWRKSIVAFTHGTSLPPDGPNGYPLSHEAFFAQQTQIIQRLISHSAGESEVENSGLTVPVCVIENHPSVEKKGHEETLLHNGESLRSQLLLLCCSMKLLSEVSSEVMNQSSLDYGRLFGLNVCSPFLQPSVLPEMLNETSMNVVSDQETEAAESEAVPLAEMTLPPSFDGLEPSYFASKPPSSRLLTRPVFDYQNWDHGCNFNDVIIEDETNIANSFPAVMSVQLIKDKKELILQLPSSVSAKHGDKVSITMARLDIRILEEKLGYTTLKGKTKIKNFRKNQTASGVSMNFAGENVVSTAVGKQIVLVGNAGIIQSQGDVAYRVNYDFCRRDKDRPINEDKTSVGMSLMRYRDDLIYGCNLRSQIAISRNSKLDITAALNNRLRGQISIKTSSCDQLQIAALALIPIAGSVVNKFFRWSTG